MKVVMVFGAFDGVHPGHVDFFRQAKEFGGLLVVSVGLDRNVEKIKGEKPLFSESERLEVIRDILKSIQRTRSIKPTRLLYSSNLSPQMFKE
ncbi:MAG: FAD synthase [Candidatus Curtissbacteria bacterium GW2011_GWA1_40_9]|uniref:FAD synthase n=1 Tax=Candidatus Curtissbacteria bacterium GW2011_GWA1_40_9 TaxID=1618408 RepID=A0A0G0TLM8_9BACT|nr:MAG: FAD synthase [Candidatus Curtissbacteria bacterium GW2011_GWA1_40_9]